MKCTVPLPEETSMKYPKSTSILHVLVPANHQLCNLLKNAIWPHVLTSKPKSRWQSVDLLCGALLGLQCTESILF